MKYSFKSFKQITSVFDLHKELWATEISEILWKSRVTVHKYLKELVNRWILKKNWTWSKVKYLKVNNDEIVTQAKEINDIEISFQNMKILEESFLKFSADWMIMEW